jgi:hypothetical protein
MQHDVGLRYPAAVLLPLRARSSECRPQQAGSHGDSVSEPLICDLARRDPVGASLLAIAAPDLGQLPPTAKLGRLCTGWANS